LQGTSLEYIIWHNVCLRSRRW